MLEQAEKAVGRLLSSGKREPGEPFFADRHYSAFPLSKNNFHSFEPADEMPLCFVDGGNSEIISSPSFSASLVRVVAVAFGNSSRINSVSSEFLCVSTTRAESGRHFYDAEIIHLAGEKLLGEFSLDSRDPGVSQGGFSVPISATGSAARRFAEWKMAEKAAGLMEEGALVRDGTLQTAIASEGGYAEAAYGAARRRGIIFTALAKTSSLLTTTGVSLTYAIDSLSSGVKPPWHYFPITKNTQPDHKAEIYCVKLHDRGAAFRFEVLRGQDALAALFASLAFNASDLAFPGYPYGLVVADDEARVPQAEAQALKALFEQFGGEDWREIKKQESATNAHDILDSL